MILKDEMESLKDDVSILCSETNAVCNTIESNREEMNVLEQQMKKLADALNLDLPETDHEPDFHSIICSDVEVENALKEFETVLKRQKASNTDYIVATIAGVLSVIIDVVLVGAPEVVKLYKGGERFDGSILTKAIRDNINMEDDNLVSTILNWLSDKCKVPYDMSAVSDTVNPNNHRLRSFAHDPVFGLLFAVADIIFGTTTCIDNEGKLTILVNKNYESDNIEKYLCVLFYLGHIISDIFTARGIPIPGFFLTQFFTNGGDENSLARIAEDMYKGGYDLRHMASMSVPVIVKNIIVDVYCKMTEKSTDSMLPIAEKELITRDNAVRKEQMLFVANAVATAGNFGKFLLPPCCANPSALNMPQWLAMIRSSILMVRIEVASRENAAEMILQNRKNINDNWDELLK